MTPEEAKAAQRDGSFVAFEVDGVGYLGTVVDLRGDIVTVDVIGYRNGRDNWRLRLLGPQDTPAASLRLYQGMFTGMAGVEESADQTLRLFAVGDEVETEDGPGVVTGIAFNAAEYHEGWQLEPPLVEVELTDGSSIHTCLCNLTLDSEEGTKLLHSEFDRLWPPMDDVPEDADMLIPEGDEEPSEGDTEMREPQHRKADSDDQVRIYIADLEAYNAGKLRGEWVDLPSYGELKDVVDRMSHGGRSDWAIHDYEAPFRIEEFEDVFALDAAMEKAEAEGLDLKVLACIKDMGYQTWEEAIEAAEEAQVIDIADKDGHLPGNPEAELGYY